MYQAFRIALLGLFLVSCSDTNKNKPVKLATDESGQAVIVLKENQSVVLMREGDLSLRITAFVGGDRLIVAGPADRDRHFSVAWETVDSWNTDAILQNGRERVAIFDNDGDGIPDWKVEGDPLNKSRYELDEIRWRPHSAFNRAASGETTDTEQAGTGQPATRPESKSEGSDKPQPESEGRSR